jgi:hypothetical protein
VARMEISLHNVHIRGKMKMMIRKKRRKKVMSVFFASARNRVVKIMRSSSEVVLQTIEHTVIYPDLGLS